MMSQPAFEYTPEQKINMLKMLVESRKASVENRPTQEAKKRLWQAQRELNKCLGVTV